MSSLPPPGIQPSPLGPILRLSSPVSEARISLLGAQLLSWTPRQPPSSAPILFLPPLPRTPPAPGTEIHGGIPVCWPWFGRMGPDGSLPHGLARYLPFTLLSTDSTGASASALLELASPHPAPANFPHPFLLRLRVTVGDAIELTLTATNTGEKTFPVTAGFHPYLRVSDSASVLVEGFDAVPFTDWPPASPGAPQPLQHGPYRPLPGSRVFSAPVPSCSLIDPALRRRAVLSATGHARWCVWRSAPIPPGTTRSNLRPEDTSSFLCIEPVVFPRADALLLPPGASHTMTLSIRPEPLP